MKKLILLFSALLLSFQFTIAQRSVESMKYFKKYEVPINRNITINYIDYFVYINILEDDPQVKTNDELYYYWYSANDIKRTKGGYSGKLLHGAYTEYYPNKNLKAQGKFRYGLKQGEWKSWHPNGEYDEISYWKKGRKEGLAKFYNDKGELIRESEYKNDELHGITKIYDVNSIEIIRYRHGKSYIRVKERKKVFRIFKKESKNKLKAEDKKAKIDSRWQRLKNLFGRKEKKQKNKIEELKKKEDRQEHQKQQRIEKKT